MSRRSRARVERHASLCSSSAASCSAVATPSASAPHVHLELPVRRGRAPPMRSWARSPGVAPAATARSSSTGRCHRSPLLGLAGLADVLPRRRTVIRSPAAPPPIAPDRVASSDPVAPTAPTRMTRSGGRSRSIVEHRAVRRAPSDRRPSGPGPAGSAQGLDARFRRRRDLHRDRVAVHEDAEQGERHVRLERHGHLGRAPPRRRPRRRAGQPDCARSASSASGARERGIEDDLVAAQRVRVETVGTRGRAGVGHRDERERRTVMTRQRSRLRPPRNNTITHRPRTHNVVVPAFVACHRLR